MSYFVFCCFPTPRHAGKFHRLRQDVDSPHCACNVGKEELIPGMLCASCVPCICTPYITGAAVVYLSHSVQELVPHVASARHAFCRGFCNRTFAEELCLPDSIIMNIRNKRMWADEIPRPILYHN